MLARGERPDATPVTLDTGDVEQWPDDLAEVLYIDHYGNATTGYRAASMPQDAKIRINDFILRRASTYSDVATGEAFWYENANGLVEFSVNQGRANQQLAIRLGTAFSNRA